MGAAQVRVTPYAARRITVWLIRRVTRRHGGSGAMIKQANIAPVSPISESIGFALYHPSLLNTTQMLGNSLCVVPRETQHDCASVTHALRLNESCPYLPCAVIVRTRNRLRVLAGRIIHYVLVGRKTSIPVSLQRTSF